MARKSTTRKKPPGGPTAGLPPVTVHAVCADAVELKARAEEELERLDWGPAMLQLPVAWQRTRGRGVTVAVLDTGVDLDHPDLAGAIKDKHDFTGDGIADADGHGTHVAGVVAARLNSVGFVGVAPEADLLIAKVLGNDGSGAFEWIAAGVDWAVAKGADIISMSLGGPANAPSLYTAIHKALAADKIVVCAAGNEGSIFRNAIGYPGRYGGVITVAAHDRNGNPAGFSSRGGEIDLMAPGTDIWSSYLDGGYAQLSGTSMATPFVSGVCALILAKHRGRGTHNTPVDNNEDMRQHLVAMTAHPGHHDNAAGYGPLQAFWAAGPEQHQGERRRRRRPDPR